MKNKKTPKDNWAKVIRTGVKIIIPNHEGKIPVRLDDKTIILVRPDADIEKILKKYRAVINLKHDLFGESIQSKTQIKPYDDHR